MDICNKDNWFTSDSNTTLQKAKGVFLLDFFRLHGSAGLEFQIEAMVRLIL